MSLLRRTSRMRSAAPVVAAVAITRTPSRISCFAADAILSTSPRATSQTLASKIGLSPRNGVMRARTSPNAVSGSASPPLAGARPPSPADDHAASRSSSTSRMSSCARSSVRLGSTTSTRVPAGSASRSTGGSSQSESISASTPSNVIPSARRFSSIRSPGCFSIAAIARPRTSSVGNSSRHGYASMRSTRSSDR